MLNITLHYEHLYVHLQDTYVNWFVADGNYSICAIVRNECWFCAGLLIRASALSIRTEVGRQCLLISSENDLLSCGRDSASDRDVFLVC